MAVKKKEYGIETPGAGNSVPLILYSVFLSLIPSAFSPCQEETFNTSHVTLYPKPDHLMEKSKRLVEQRKWDELLTIYEEAAKNYPNHVVPVANEDDILAGYRDARRYLGVWEFCLRQIRRWPSEGRSAYRAWCEPRARRRFETAKSGGDQNGLKEILEKYPFTPAAQDALLLMANLALDSGDARQAVTALEEVAAENATPTVLARLGWAYSLAQDRPRLDLLIQRVEREFPETSIVSGSDRLPLLTVLRRFREHTSTVQTDDGSSWETIFGDSSGTQRVKPDAILHSLGWTATLSTVRFSTQNEGISRTTIGPSHDYRPLYPVYADGILYAANEYTLEAYALFSPEGKKLWSFRQPVPPGEYAYEDRAIHTVTVHGGRVYAPLIAALGGTETQMGYIRVKFPFPKRALFCFEAYTGQRLWRAGGEPEADLFERTLSFTTAPTPDADRLYVGAIHQAKSTDPFEHYAVCLDAETGRVLWKTFVASGGTEINLFGNSTRESLGSPVAILGDTLCYSTNVGAITGLDRRSGRIQWVYRYQQQPVNPTRSVYIQKNPMEWVNTMPVAVQGQFIVAPTDAPYLYALDAQSGHCLWWIPRPTQRGNVRYVYGVKNTTLVLGGDILEFYDLSKGGKFLGTYAPDQRGTGRGLVSDEGVYFPTEGELSIVTYPDPAPRQKRAVPWPSPVGNGGSLMIVDGAVVLAGHRTRGPLDSISTLSVFFDRAKERTALLEALRRDPENIRLAYRTGLHLLQAGEQKEAVTLFEKVIVRTIPSSNPADRRLNGGARRWLYILYRDLAGQALERRDFSGAVEAYRRARPYTADRQAEVECCFLSAGAWERMKNYAAALAAYQEILKSRPEVVIEGERARDRARNRIAEILKLGGPTLSSSLTAEAEHALRRAQDEGMPESFVRVYDIYPNSLQAEQSLLLAAGAYRRLGRLEESIYWARVLLREYPDSVLAPEGHVLLVHIFEERRQFPAAASVLRRMKGRFPDRHLTDADRRISVREFVEARLSQAEYHSTSEARTEWALTPPLKRVLGYTDPDFSEGMPLTSEIGDLIMVNYGSTLRAIDRRSGNAPWSFLSDGAIRFARPVRNAWLIGTDHSITRIDAATGETEWKKKVSSPIAFALGEATLFLLGPDPGHAESSALYALDAEKGNFEWYQPMDGPPLGRIFAARESVAVITASPNRLHLFDGETGAKRFSKKLSSEEGDGELIHLTDALALVSSGPGFIEAYTVPDGTQKWRLSLPDLEHQSTGIAGTMLGLFANRSIGNILMLLDLSTGKRSAVRENLPVGNTRWIGLDDRFVYLVSRQEDTNAVVIVGLNRADLSQRWQIDVGGENASLATPIMTPTHIVVVTIERDDRGKMGYILTLIEKDGTLAQNIKSAFVWDRPPNVLVDHGAIIVSVDHHVEVYR